MAHHHVLGLNKHMEELAEANPCTFQTVRNLAMHYGKGNSLYIYNHIVFKKSLYLNNWIICDQKTVIGAQNAYFKWYIMDWISKGLSILQ